jgi:putative FmdB family regulatory protein
MPIYEYKCDGCGEVFEERQKMADPPLKKHAACGSKKVKKLISMTSFQLKGEGWYVTDYKKRPAEATEAKADAKSDAKATESDAKPADAKATEAKVDKKAEPKSEPTKSPKSKKKTAA